MNTKSIIKLCSLFCYISKYAGIEELIARLKVFNVDNNIINYIESLPDNHKGFAANLVLKNISISLSDLEDKIDEHIINKNKIETLKIKTLQNAIPVEYQKQIPEKYKDWFSKQITKYVDLKDEVLSKIKEIVEFTEETGININNYDAKKILQELKPVNYNHPLLENFFNFIIQEEEKQIRFIGNNNLKKYAKIKFAEFRKEWLKKILKESESKSINDIFRENYEVGQKMNNGELIGVDLPPTVLHHDEYSKLLQNLSFIQDFLNGVPEFKLTTQVGVYSLINMTRKYHEEVAKAGKGKQYDPFNFGNVIAGPEWNNSEWNGYIILELKSVNDLQVEGFKLHHCVGGEPYPTKLKEKRCRIFSFRKIGNLNQPLVTFETDMGMIVLRQIYAENNSIPERKFIDMAYQGINASEMTKESYDSLTVEDKLKIAANPNLPTYLCERLANDEYESVRIGIAANPNLPIELCDILVNDKEDFVRATIAKNPNLPINLYDILVKDNNMAVRIATTANPNFPKELYKVLAEDKCWEVRMVIARKPNLPTEVCEILAKDEDFSVKTTFLCNPNVPIELRI